MSWDAQNYVKLDPRSCWDVITYIDVAPYISNDTIAFNLTLGQQVADDVC